MTLQLQSYGLPLNYDELSAIQQEDNRTLLYEGLKISAIISMVDAVASYVFGWDVNPASLGMIIITATIWFFFKDQNKADFKKAEEIIKKAKKSLDIPIEGTKDPKIHALNKVIKTEVTKFSRRKNEKTQKIVQEEHLPKVRAFVEAILENTVNNIERVWISCEPGFSNWFIAFSLKKKVKKYIPALSSAIIVPKEVRMRVLVKDTPEGKTSPATLLRFENRHFAPWEDHTGSKRLRWSSIWESIAFYGDTMSIEVMNRYGIIKDLPLAIHQDRTKQYDALIRSIPVQQVFEK